MRRSLIYYWRVHLGLLLGTAVATTALTGALLVGDSMRGSLRDLALERLGQIDYALLAAHFFRSDLTTELPGGHAPAILLNGSARHAETRALAAGVQIQGIDTRFAALFPQDGPALRDALKPTPDQPFPSLVVSASLQRALGLELGDAVLLSLERPSPTYRESLFGRRATDDLVTTLRVVLTGVLPDSGAGRFGLRLQQHLPLNAYLDLQTLQRALGQQDRVNALLIAAPNSQHQDLQRALAQHLTLADLKLDLALHSNYIELTSTRFVLDDSIRTAALASGAALQLQTATFSTYLANAIEGNGRQVPYSTITALDDPTGLYLADGQPAPLLAADALYLDAWTAQELAATPGDSISLTYYVVGPREEFRTEQAHFRLQGIVQMRGLAIDPTLTPEYPGLQEEGDMSAWDAPFPIDMGKIRPQDEAYWDQYGAAPKAFVATHTGQRLWSSRHGSLTAIRFYPSSSTQYESLHQDLVNRLSPTAAGFSLRPVRQEALLASTGATDFSGLFIGFSLFLIAAAALLVVLLCKFGLEQRAREAGLLLATGYPLTAVARRFLGEGIALAALGALLGLAGAPLYAYLMLVGLHTLWLEAIGTPFLQLHVSWLSLGLGYLSTLLLVSLALWRTVQRFHRLPVRALLAGNLDTASRRPRRRSAVFAALGLALALTLSILAGMADAATAAALFLGSGTAALLALLALFALWLRAPTSGRLSSSLGLGLLNSTRKPSRSALCTSLVACATFVIVAAGAHRQVEWSDDPGTGGFSLVAEAEIPLHQDLNSADGRFELGLSTDLSTARFFPFRVLPGDDVSCLNLYLPQTPRVLGAPAEFVQRGGLPFRQTLALTPDERTNPYRLLHPSHRRL
ncbi:MAG: ABC transporter permease [Candidatus Latescibacteria bacterium]|nr:ABC transporter permease [Candidatus Latescibacterota bacterium]